jgi:CRP/FNR family cyclic AMP-dependent transcriptional regulator
MPVNYFKHAKDFEDFTAGTHIIEVGGEGDKMYVVREGEVEIVFEDTVLETVGEGGFFGEMALIDDPIRSATAIAKTDCKLVPVDRDRFLFMVQETPTFALQVMQLLTQRIRRMNEVKS